MKIISCFISLISAVSFAQILEPVKWSVSFDEISETEYDIVFTAEIESGWHLYSQHIAEGGPLPTVFKFLSNDNYKCEGQPTEENGKDVYEDVFEMQVKYFENKTVFKQRIKTVNNAPFKLKGDIQYMSCNKEKCIPGYTNFETSIN